MITKSSSPRFKKTNHIFLAFVLFLLMAVFFCTGNGLTREYSGLPLSDFKSDNFVGSGKCAVCHHLLVDEQGKSASIHDHWRGTMMANAAKDPLWQAIQHLKVLLRKNVLSAICRWLGPKQTVKKWKVASCRDLPTKKIPFMTLPWMVYRAASATS